MPRLTAQDRADIRGAHSSALQKSSHETQLRSHFTSIYFQVSVLLVAASAFPTFVETADDRVAHAVGGGLSLIGLGLTWVFRSIAVRLGQYNAYWVSSARELERYMAEQVQANRHSIRTHRSPSSARRYVHHRVSRGFDHPPSISTRPEGQPPHAVAQSQRSPAGRQGARTKPDRRYSAAAVVGGPILTPYRRFSSDPSTRMSTTSCGGDWILAALPTRGEGSAEGGRLG